MKTAEEVAKEIWFSIPRDLGSERWCDYISKALTAFADERVKEALEKMAWGDLQKLTRNEGIREGRIEGISEGREFALEEAAKSLDPLYVMKGSENDGMVFIPDAQAVIRALKGKP